MKKEIRFLILLLISCLFGFSQNSDIPIDRGLSHDTENITNESVTVPLFEVTIEGASVPIYLSYNTNGFRVTDLPSNVGFGWSLHAGGGIEKQTKHLIDESPNGWLFNDNINNIQTGEYSGAYISWYNGTHPEYPSQVFQYVDTEPDTFHMKMSNGFNVDYMYSREGIDENSSVGNHNLKILNDNTNVTVTTNFHRLYNYSYNDNYDDGLYNSDDEYDVRVHDRSGTYYLFRKGIKREMPWSLQNRPRTQKDSSYFDNYYIHKIKTQFNNESIDFEYVETDIKKLIPYASGIRIQSNSDPMNPPHPSDPVLTEDYYDDISVEDKSRKDIKRIIGPRETVEFTYKFHNYNNLLSDIQNPPSTVTLNKLQDQSVRLLDQIKVYDHLGNYILGYKFNYTHTQQIADQNEYEGDFKLKSIIKYGKNHKSNYLYRGFEYNYFNRPSVSTTAVDVLGYYNGHISNDPDNLTPIYLDGQSVSFKLPNEDRLIEGMLKTIINKDGGKTEFLYKENSFRDIYYGGLLIKTISKLDRNNNLLSQTEYKYEQPDGYGLPVYNTDFDSSTNRPIYTYEDGYYEYLQQHYSWQTYFTKRDPNIELDDQLTYYKVSNTPFELMKHTPFLDAYVDQFVLNEQSQEMAYAGLSQLNYGVVYKKITQSKINVNSNQAEKGKTISYYEPTIIGYDLGKQLVKKENFNTNNVKVSEITYNYEKKYIDYQQTYYLDRLHRSAYRYFVNYAFVFDIKNVLRSTTKKHYDTDGVYLYEESKTFEYLDESNTELVPDYSKIKLVNNFHNGELYSKTEKKYMSEYSIFNGPFSQDLAYLYEVNPSIEEIQWAESNGTWLLKSSTASSFDYDGKLRAIYITQKNPTNGKFFTQSNYTSPYFDAQGYLISNAEDAIEYTYDDLGYLVSEKDVRRNISKLYQRSAEYNGLYVDAILTTNEDYLGETNYFLKKSFEDSDNPNHIPFNKAFSGDAVFNGSAVSLGAFPAGYKITYWSYENNVWKFNNYIHQGGMVTIVKPPGALYLDEVIVRPKYTDISSLTIKPIIGTTSILDVVGEGKRIEYDLYGKPLYTFDRKGNVISEYRTNSINQNINN